MSKHKTSNRRKHGSAAGRPRTASSAVYSASSRHAGTGPVRLHLGCGHKILDGYVNIDLYSPVADVKMDITTLSGFDDESVDEIYLNAVFEHLYIFEQRKALAEWRRVLKPGGSLRIDSLPDFDEIVRAYINREPGNQGGVFDIEEVSRYTHGAYSSFNRLGQIHKDVFTKAKIGKLLQRAGFEVVGIENSCQGDEPNPVNINVMATKAAEATTTAQAIRGFDEPVSYAPLSRTEGPSFAAVYCVYDDSAWLTESVESIYDACTAIYVLASDRPWYGDRVDNSHVMDTIGNLADPAGKIKLVHGSWTTEAEQRNAGLEILRERGIDYCFVIDTDEIYDPIDLKRMMKLVARYPTVECWHAEWDTYWKSCRYRIEPREPFKPTIFVKVGDVEFVKNRAVGECKHALLPAAAGICHHMSYARTDEQVLRKISSFSHAGEIREGWFENVWLAWDEDRAMLNLHPTHPTAYRAAVAQPPWAVPPALRRRFEAESLPGDEQRYPRTSIVVLARNQIDYTRRCLESIERCTPEPHEVVVVDNASTDGTAEYLGKWANGRPDRRVITNTENLGFAGGNNLGIAAAVGEYIALVNNDVVVTPGWLGKLLACAARDPLTGIVGPMSNAVSGPQFVDQPLYELESLAGLDEFSAEWSEKHKREVTQVARAVGFCWLLRRALIDKIGGLDTRFGIGNFEDDDVCVRAKVAGFNCMVARDCYVHHFGSKTFAGEHIDYDAVLAHNWEVFKSKWGLPAELRRGMGYTVPEAAATPFSVERHYCALPQLDGAGAEHPKRDITGSSRADRPILSLCVIARDEEEFLPGCLASVQGIVDEIVVVDTGSRDRTPEIARSFGARVHSFTWNENYSDARNEALRHAQGEWILFLDCDERLDADSAHIVRQAALAPTADAYDLYFHNYCRDDATHAQIIHRVCRMIRNRPEYHFQGRVHENIVPSVVASGGVVGQLEAVIHHYGYQPDVKKRRNKHERYVSLLRAELEDVPGDFYVLHHLAAAHCAEQEFDEAIGYLQQLTATIPADHPFAPQAFSRLANAYWATNRQDEAIATAETAREKGICHPEITFAVGNARLAQNKYDEAILAFQEAISLGSTQTWLGDPGTWGYKAEFGIARALAALGRYGEALEHGEKVIRDRPEHIQARELTAVAAEHIDRLDKAKMHWSEVLSRVPDHTAAMVHLAQIHERAGSPLEAIRQYEAALQVAPDAVEVHTDLGRLLAGQGRVQEALDCFVRAVELRPDYANAYFSAGDALYAAGRFLEAAEVYENGLSRDPSHAEGFFALGNCCFRMGALEEAAATYRQALAIRPDYADARANLALAEEAIADKQAA